MVPWFSLRCFAPFFVPGILSSLDWKKPIPILIKDIDIQWIGLRENLQETMVFTIKYMGFRLKFSHHPILWDIDWYLYIPSGYLLEFAMVYMALIEIDGLPNLKNGWIFPWWTVTNNQMVYPHVIHISFHHQAVTCFTGAVNHGRCARASWSTVVRSCGWNSIGVSANVHDERGKGFTKKHQEKHEVIDHQT